MDIEKQEVIFCEDNDKNRVICEICDKLCIERYYKNHLKSGTHTKVFYKKSTIK